MKNLILFFVAIILTFGCKQNQTISTHSTLKNYFDSSSIPSAIMGSIDKDGHIDWHAFGPSIWGGSDTVTEDYIFRIYSMTKAIASVAAMQLVEKGLIGLDDPLNELMPGMVSIPILDENENLQESDHAITLRHLLTHTAGFGYNFTSSRLSTFNTESWNHEDRPRLFQPGTHWIYGTNTDWVGRLIEKISGQSLETYLRENISGPLKMNSTWFNVPENLSEKIVSWGARDTLENIVAYDRLPKSPVTKFSAGGGLFSSPRDYLTFLKCMLNYGKYEGGQLIKRETLELMLKDQLPKGVSIEHEKFKNSLLSFTGDFYDESDRWGLAWAIEANENELIRPLNTAYWSGAANSYFSFNVESQIAVVYFTQYFPFNDQETFDFYRLFEKEVYAGAKNE